MEIRPHRIIKRRKTREIKVGKVSVGGDSLISVQSMTNTLTTDIKKTIEQIKLTINSSKTILWNGPAGYFENNDFAEGSFEIAKEISKKTKEGKIYSVIGGGDTVAVVNKLKLFKDFNFVSTAGGAFLEFLEGKELPGIRALN